MENLTPGISSLSFWHIIPLCIPPYLKQHVWKAVGGLRRCTGEGDTVRCLDFPLRPASALLSCRSLPGSPFHAKLPPVSTSHPGNEKLGCMEVSLCTHPCPPQQLLAD